MILTWILAALLIGALVGLAALALDGACRALRLPTRWPWVSALVFSVAWPLWQALHPAPSAASGTVNSAGTVLPPLIIVGGQAIRTFAARLMPVGEHVSLVLLAVWSLVSGVLLGRLGIGLWTLRRQRQTWAAQQLDGVPVLVAAETGPAVVGVRRLAIVLPAWVFALDPALRRLVLAHEVQHVRARDPLLRLLGPVLTALMPWNVALWWQVSRLGLATETDCDSRVLRQYAERDRYAHLLLAIAQRQSAAALASALSRPTSDLERRITAMRRNTPRRPLLVASTLVSAAVVAVVLACSTTSPSAPSRASNNRTTAPTSAMSDRTTDGAYLDSHVDKQARAYPGNPRPLYPTALQQAGIGGEVTLQFVIDSTGHIDMKTVKVVKADNDQFTISIRSAMPRMRFYPAEVNGQRVNELVVQPFAFQVDAKR